MIKYLLLILILISLSVSAVPAPPMIATNQAAKECAQFFMGDECITCELPAGWQAIDAFECPSGYKEVNVNAECTPIKDQFCCTAIHTGADGDCEDVVVNEIDKKCAFVDDINNCPMLPENWYETGKTCPSLDYEWMENIECELEHPETIYTPPIQKQKDIISNQNYAFYTTIFTVLGILLILAVAIVFLKLRKNSD